MAFATINQWKKPESINKSLHNSLTLPYLSFNQLYTRSYVIFSKNPRQVAHSERERESSSSIFQTITQMAIEASSSTMSNSKIILIVNVLYLNMHMQAWFMDETSGEDQRLPRHCYLKELVSPDYLAGQISLSISVSFFWVLYSLSLTPTQDCVCI